MPSDPPCVYRGSGTKVGRVKDGVLPVDSESRQRIAGAPVLLSRIDCLILQSRGGRMEDRIQLYLPMMKKRWWW